MGVHGRKKRGPAVWLAIGWLAVVLIACGPVPLEVPIAPWSRAWPAGELPSGIVACLVIQQALPFFERLGPALDQVGLLPPVKSLDPSGRKLIQWSGVVFLEPERFDVPLVMAYDIQDPTAVVDWQRKLRMPLAAIGTTSIWSPKGFDSDAVFRRGAAAIPSRPQPFLFMRLTDKRLVSAFDPASLGLSVPYLLGQLTGMGDAPAARLRLRPDRLVHMWFTQAPEPEQFWAMGAAELKKGFSPGAPAWIGLAIDGLAGLAHQLRWIQADLVLRPAGGQLEVRLAFEPGSGPASWTSGLPLGEAPLEVGLATLGMDAGLLEAAQAARVRLWREADHLRVTFALLPIGPGVVAPATGS